MRALRDALSPSETRTLIEIAQHTLRLGDKPREATRLIRLGLVNPGPGGLVLTPLGQERYRLEAAALGLVGQE